MRTSENGIKLIQKFEGLRLKAYKDVIGIITIGYGHVDPSLTLDTTWSEAQAINALHLDLRKFEDGINEKVKVTLTQNQFDAICSFCYNVGLGNFYKSTLLKLINLQDFTKANLEFPKWRSAGGKIVPTLVKRRTEEQELFKS